jgi:hypothetical protein
VTGTDWASLPNVAPGNRLRLRLENVARARLAGRRAGLSGGRCLHVTIDSDGAARVVLALQLPKGARARRGDACRASAPAAPEVALGRRSATFSPGSGARSWVILPE